METIHIHTHLDSEKLDLPELRPFIGLDVEIVVRPKTDREPKFSRLGSATEEERIAHWREIGPIDVDEDAVKELRRISAL